MGGSSAEGPHSATQTPQTEQGTSTLHPAPAAGLPALRAGAPAGGLMGGALPASVVEVQGADAAADGDAAAGPSGDAGLLLVSSGAGDLSLVARPTAAQQQGQGGAAAPAAVLSPPLWPLRPAPPLQGARSLHLAAAFRWSGGTASSSSGGGGGSELDICCVAWAARPRAERQPSRAEVYAIRLAAQLGPAPALAVQEVQLLKARWGQGVSGGSESRVGGAAVLLPQAPAAC